MHGFFHPPLGDGDFTVAASLFAACNIGFASLDGKDFLSDAALLFTSCNIGFASLEGMDFFRMRAAWGNADESAVKSADAVDMQVTSR